MIGTLWAGLRTFFWPVGGRPRTPGEVWALVRGSVQLAQANLRKMEGDNEGCATHCRLALATLERFEGERVVMNARRMLNAALILQLEFEEAAEVGARTFTDPRFRTKAGGWSTVAGSYVDAERFEEGARFAQCAIDAFKDDEAPLVRAWCHTLLAMSTRGDEEACMAASMAAITAYGEVEDFESELAVYVPLHHAEVLRRAGRLEEALAVLERLSVTDPLLDEAKGETLYGLERWEEAEAALLPLAEARYSACHLLAQICVQQDRLEDALAWCRRTREKAPSVGYQQASWMQEAEVLKELQRHQEVVDLARRTMAWLDTDPQDPGTSFTQEIVTLPGRPPTPLSQKAPLAKLEWMQREVRALRALGAEEADEAFERFRTACRDARLTGKDGPELDALEASLE